MIGVPEPVGETEVGMWCHMEIHGPEGKVYEASFHWIRSLGLWHSMALSKWEQCSFPSFLFAILSDGDNGDAKAIEMQRPLRCGPSRLNHSFSMDAHCLCPFTLASAEWFALTGLLFILVISLNTAGPAYAFNMSETKRHFDNVF